MLQEQVTEKEAQTQKVGTTRNDPGDEYNGRREEEREREEGRRRQREYANQLRAQMAEKVSEEWRGAKQRSNEALRIPRRFASLLISLNGVAFSSLIPF